MKLPGSAKALLDCRQRRRLSRLNKGDTKERMEATAVHEREGVNQQIRSAVRHTAVYGIGNFLTKAVGFLLLPLYTHYLSPYDYGVFEILELSMSLLGMFLNMGTTGSVLRCYTGAPSPQEKRKVISTAIVFVSAVAVVTALLGLVVARQASEFLVGPAVPAKYFVISFVSFLVGYVANLGRTYLRAMEFSGSIVVAETVTLIVTLVLNVYFVVVLKIGLLGILLGPLVGGTLLSVFLVGWTLRDVGVWFGKSHCHAMLTFGWPLMVSNMAIFALNFSDRFFLQHLRSLELVGIYSIGYKFGFMINYLLVQPFTMMWQTRMYLVGERPDHAAVFKRIFVSYSVMLIYGGLAVSMLSPEIVTFMVDRRFVASQDVIPLIALSYIFYGISMYLQTGLLLANKTRVIGLVGLASAALNLVLNYFLIIRFGIFGAAWATVLSFAAIAVGNYWQSQRALRLQLGMGGIVLALMTSVGIYLLSRWWVPPSWEVSLAVKLLFLAALPLLAWGTGGFRRSGIGWFPEADAGGTIEAKTEGR